MSATASQAPGLVLVWVTQDPEAIRHMIFMYAKNSRLKGWWDDVLLIVWGPSARLLSEDVELQAELADIQQAGVRVQACKACADRYGVSERLQALNVEVVYVGQALTDHLKGGSKVLSI